MISIIIVNYNGCHFLDDCLSALEHQTCPRDRFEVLLVDNASVDGSADHVRAHFPWVRVIDAGRNLGFAAGNNLGFRHARGELIALLNNDTIVDPGWLAALVATLGDDPTIGATTSKILLRDEPGVLNSTGLNLYRDGRGGDRGFRELDVGQYDRSPEVFGACGASVLLRRSLLDDIGEFDESFFMYCEDLDLFWRAQRRGWRCVYTPASVVRHVHCGTSGEGSPFFTYYWERNRVFVNIKNGSPGLALYSLAVFCGRAGRKWLRVVTGREATKQDWRQALAYLRAAGSLLLRVPEMLAKRVVIRILRRRAADDDFAHLVSPSPPRREAA